MNYKILLVLPVLFLSLVSFTWDASTLKKEWKTEEYSVTGNCGSCETRIENAALIQGVRSAEWDKKAQKLKVVYNPAKTSKEEILKAVADAGHDNELYKATDNKYNSLPGCCQYRGEGHNIH